MKKNLALGISRNIYVRNSRCLARYLTRTVCLMEQFESVVNNFESKNL